MKIKSLLYTTLAASLLLGSCNLNDQPKFDDATQAFIAFSTTSGRLFEAKDGVPDTLSIELYCASVAGITASVKVEATAEAYPENIRAKENENFKIEGNTEIKFDADNRFATIKIVAVDNDTQDGNHKFDLVLTDVNGCNLGANKRFTVTILDDEAPINMLIGTYTATAESMFQGEPTQVWTVDIDRDFETEDEITITPICAINGAPYHHPVTAVVDVTMSTITVPFGQSIYGGEGESMNIILVGISSEGMSMPSGRMMATYTIDSDGLSFAFTTSYGANEVNSGSWYQALRAPVTFVKQ